jgi:hypothetical protein
MIAKIGYWKIFSVSYSLRRRVASKLKMSAVKNYGHSVALSFRGCWNTQKQYKDI